MQANLSLIPEQIFFRNELVKTIVSSYKKFSGKKIVVWGTGVYGKFMAQLLNRELPHSVIAFCNTFHDESEQIFIDGVKVHSPDYLFKHHPDAVFILSNDFYEDIISLIKKTGASVEYYSPSYFERQLEKQLLYYSFPRTDDSVTFDYNWIRIYKDLSNNGLLQSHLQSLKNLLTDDISVNNLDSLVNFFVSGDLNYLEKIHIDRKEYFSTDYIPLGKDEVYWDCGAFDGDSIRDFMESVSNEYMEIVGFEPDPKNFNKLASFVKDNNLNQVFCYPYALSKENDELMFSSTGGVDAKISQDSSDLRSIKVKVISLDSFYKECKSCRRSPTIIKLDVEGFEKDTIKGAEGIIKKYHPTLIVCIHHLPLDLFDIPVFIKTIVPEYKFKLRQHKEGFIEYVLYAYTE